MSIVDLQALCMAPEQVEERRRFIGGSDATRIMSGEPDQLLALWEVKTGRRRADDLSNSLPALMGLYTEPLNAAWFERRTGHMISDRGGVFTCAERPWRRASLDGRTVDAVWEAKHVNGISKPLDVVARYQPQLHHNMAVCGLRHAHLSIFKGSADWLHFEVDYDEAYGAALLEAETEFWAAVEGDEPPVPYPAPEPPAPAAWRELDMTGSNEWGAVAAEFLATVEAAKAHDGAKAAIKKLVPTDVRRAHAYGVEAVRDGRGVTVRAAAA